MPSPFPGMAPYLEGELWQEFHETLAGEIRAQPLKQLPAKYVALLAKRCVIGTPTSGILPGLGLNIVDWPAQRVIYPDVHAATMPLARGNARPAGGRAAADGVLRLPEPHRAPPHDSGVAHLAARTLAGGPRSPVGARS